MKPMHHRSDIHDEFAPVKSAREITAAVFSKYGEDSGSRLFSQTEANYGKQRRYRFPDSGQSDRVVIAIAAPLQRHAFTLIELLAVISIIAILAAMLMPVLSNAKMQAWRAQSTNNIRNLQLGALMYANDNKGCLLPNAPYSVPLSGVKAWVDVSTNAYIEGLQYQKGNTNMTIYTDALLAPFLFNQLGVYKSPADITPSLNGQRIRSYSMNGQMGCIYTNPPYDAPAIGYCKESDLKFPITPSQGFVFCEESPYTINDGYLEVFTQPNNPGFPDVPAAYLGGACAFSFADGHAEIHRWRTWTVLNATGHTPTLIGGRKNVDWMWLSQHTAANPP